MKHLFFMFFTLCLLISCNERIVKLPETTNKDITEIIDVSPIYMFYDEETDSVEFNRKNMISTTNWLVNIDKRLTLKQILPHLQYLQEKRRDDGMHKNENAKNYFTCSNTDLKNLSFIEFTNLTFDSELQEITSHDFATTTYFSYAKFNSFKDIQMSIASRGHGLTKEYDINQFLNDIDGLLKSGKLNLKLSFNSKLSFQDYISIKSKLLTIKSDSLKISNQEIIFN